MTNPPPGAITSAPVREVASALPVLSPVVVEIVKLAQARVSDEVLLAYLEKTRGEFTLTAEEIVYLHDLGLSETVITALIKRSKASPAVAAKVPPTAAPTPEPAAPPVAEAQPVQLPVANGPVPSTAVPVVMADAPQPVTYFYQSLAPYGSWLEVPDYGWCWQPTVAVIDTAWRPYCHRGRWLYTDSGWYWQSDYSWGWAPFHYGRWSYHARCGWVWVPGSTWAPAWVSWRRSATHCGWAPLPPDAYYGIGGFTQHGLRVGVTFEFGLSHHYYHFLPVARFCDANPYPHYIWGASAGAIYQQSTVINNYHLGRNTIVNAGPLTREQVAKASRSEVRKVAVLELPAAGGNAVRPDRLVPTGQSLTIYRPAGPSRRDQELRKDTAPSVTTNVPITRKENGPRSQSAVANSPAASSSVPLDNGATTRPSSPTAPLNRAGQASGTRSPFAPALSGGAPQPSQQEPAKPATLKRRSPDTATADPVNPASSLPRQGVEVPSAPQPVTSVPTFPRPAGEILRPPQPIAPMQPNVQPGREFTSALQPVTSVPTAPRAGVDVPAAPNTFRPQTTTPQFNSSGSVYQPRSLYNPQPLVNQPAYQAPVQRQELRRTPPNSFQQSYTTAPVQPQTSRPSFVNPAGPVTQPQAVPSPQHRPQFVAPPSAPSAPVNRPSFQSAPAPSAAPSRPAFNAPPAAPTHRSEPSHAPAMSRPSSPGGAPGLKRDEDKK